MTPYQRLDEDNTLNKLTGYNLHTHNVFNQDFFTTMTEQGTTKDRDKYCLDVMQVPFIGKDVRMCLDGTYSYFLTSKKLENKRIDLLNYGDMRDMVKNIKVLGELILVQLEKNCLVFDQSTMLYKYEINANKTRVLTLPY